jgi:hypothetical protein
MADGHGGRPWQTAVVDEEVENLEEKALHLLQHFHASRNSPLDSKVNVLISGAHGHECFSRECS